ncbi:MAG: hypothetical protein AAFQ98_18635, partial [Bacteroidota bacterium]
MPFFLRIGCLMALVWVPLASWAQHAAEPQEAHQVEAGTPELILSGIYSIPLSGTGNIAPGHEVHLTYWVSHRWGGGFSYTTRYEEHLAHDIALIASWNPARWLTVNSGPNFALANEERELEMGLYLETECNW